MYIVIHSCTKFQRSFLFKIDAIVIAILLDQFHYLCWPFCLNQMKLIIISKKQINDSLHSRLWVGKYEF